MVGSFEFEAEVRTTTGKGEARRSRRLGKIPAIVYGGGGDQVQLYLTHHRVSKALENDAVYSHVLTIRYDGKEIKAVLKALQRHPSKPIVMHMDFQGRDQRSRNRRRHESGYQQNLESEFRCGVNQGFQRSSM